MSSWIYWLYDLILSDGKKFLGGSMFKVFVFSILVGYYSNNAKFSAYFEF